LPGLSKGPQQSIEDVHFHEVGAIDSIVDIVGTAICLDLLKVDKIYSSPMHDGTGFIECQHGKLPVPVPAVLEMLKESNIPYIPRCEHGIVNSDGPRNYKMCGFKVWPHAPDDY